MNDAAFSNLLAPEILPSIIGVIDLRHGVAVHGIAGNRNDYRAVEFCDGSPMGLVKHYGSLGISRLYVADLDAILGGDVQTACLDETIDSFGGKEVFLDPGWTGDAKAGSVDAIASLADRHASLRIIAATETASSTGSVAGLTKVLSPDRALLGLDYRGGAAVQQSTEPGQWLDEAERCNLHGVLVLDVAAVGTSSGVVTHELCRSIAERNPRLKIYSGGGIRSASDVNQLIRAGCHGCVVATALHRKLR